MIKRLSLALVVTLATALSIPANAQQAADDTKKPKGVKARNLVTSLGGFTATVNAPLLITGQQIELEPGGHTGRQPSVSRVRSIMRPASRTWTTAAGGTTHSTAPRSR
jgi:hypothetical protein